ncbi:phage baseplate assembly protein [Paraburkholderia sediminicola]|uniref:phage baseplate assembly protein n=1 Tax=Paraburkholderia sediminicola TaxID=458836 RepID=UPI0038B6E3FB
MSDDLTLRLSTCTINPNAAPGQPTYTTSNSRSITGWLSVRVSRGIERCPSDFDVSFTEPFPAVNDVVANPGDFCQVLLGSDVVLTGFVDRYLPSYGKNEHVIRITGRSLCQDLVDCAAHWTGMQFVSQPILTIAQQLCAVYGVKVALAPGAIQGAPIAQLNIMVGESIYAVLERLCRFRGLLLYDQPDGSLLLASGGTQAGTTASAIGTATAASGFQEGVNVLTASAMYGMDGRFSQYDAVRQGLDTCQDVGDGGNLIATVHDPSVTRFRYRAIVSESVLGGQDVAVLRANWEMASRYGRSFQVRLTTDTWRDSAGTLWTPNTLVPIDLPNLKLAPKTWLISDVTYKRDPEGTTTDLVIMPPEAFSQEPIILNQIAPDVAHTG